MEEKKGESNPKIKKQHAKNEWSVIVRSRPFI